MELELVVQQGRLVEVALALEKEHWPEVEQEQLSVPPREVEQTELVAEPEQV